MIFGDLCTVSSPETSISTFETFLGPLDPTYFYLSIKVIVSLMNSEYGINRLQIIYNGLIQILLSNIWIQCFNLSEWILTRSTKKCSGVPICFNS